MSNEFRISTKGILPKQHQHRQQKLKQHDLPFSIVTFGMAMRINDNDLIFVARSLLQNAPIAEGRQGDVCRFRSYFGGI